MDSFHLRCQRRILHTSWDDFVSNDEVLQRIGLFNVSYIVRKRRLGLFGHVARLRSDVPAIKLDPPNLCQDEGWWAAFTGVETNLRPTVYHLGPPDLSWHGCISDRGPAASGCKPFWRTIATAGGSGWSLRTPMMMMIHFCCIGFRHWYFQWLWFSP